MTLSKYAADDQGQEYNRGGNEQPRRNLFLESNKASGSRPARLTARIEFGGAQFLLRASMMERNFVTPAPGPSSRKNRRSAGSASRGAGLNF
jgi:hypothetical protein